MISIPLSFAASYQPLDWRAIAFGMEHRWLRPADAVTWAIEQIVAGSSDMCEVELAGLVDDELHRVS